MLRYAVLAALPAVGIALHSRPGAHPRQRRGLLAGRAEPETQGGECSQLTSVQGTHFIMPVLIGTPPQKFDLIPDTGSPWVIVADTECPVCDCAGANKCLNRNKSRTLQVPNLAGSGEPETATLGFGSGPIEILVTTDEVRIDGTKIRHTMDKGVLLMIDNGLGFDGPFEGLFGLGLPEYKSSKAAVGQHSYTDGFLHRAGIQSFSLCLNNDGASGGQGGVLRYNAPAGEELLGITEHTMHWQLALHGAAVGDGKVSSLCQNTDPGYASPCAAIVDSGTTYILAPYDHVDSLFSSLCDGWERCRSKYSRFRNGVMNARRSKRLGTGPELMSKSEVLQLLLNDCHTWMTHKNGILELPDLSFIVKGRAGNEYRIVLDPLNYIVSERTAKMEVTYGKVDGMSYVTGWERKSKQVWACTPAFAYMDMPTERNGPAWILGLPIFYAHRVSYNIDHNPPSMSFTHEPCGGCRKSRDLHRSNRTGGPDTTKLPRKLHGKPHLPQAARKMRLL